MYNGIIISDIHFGVIDSSTLKNELKESFFKYLDSLKQIDFIVITGDLFDHKLYVNDITTEYVVGFMNALLSIAKEHCCPVRCIYGTESHESGQYNIFSVYENDTTYNFKVIYTVKDEYLYPDLHVLYLPEEFIYDKKDYYKEYFKKNDSYDYVFGHGIIKEVMTNAVRETKEKIENKRRKVPIFTTSELDSICKGQIYFGHYHIMTNINDKIFYVGSFTRFCHGEEEDKGFFHVTCKPNKEYKQKFIENFLAKKYVTYNFGYDSKALESEESLLKELNRLDEMKEELGYDYIRYQFNIPENHPNPEFIIRILNERYKNHNNISVKITNGYVEKKKKINKEKLHELVNDFPIIFDKNAPIEDKISFFIEKKLNAKMTKDKVKKYLSKETEK